MAGRVLTLGWILAFWLNPVALAQLEVTRELADGTSEPFGASVNMGTINLGEALDWTLRVANPTANPIALDPISAGGASFTLTPISGAIPTSLAARASLLLRFRFTPTAEGTSSALLRIGPFNSLVRAFAVPAALLQMELGERRVPIAALEFINFGAIAVGQRTVRRFWLENRSQQAVRVRSVDVVNRPFAILNGGPALPANLEPGRAISFDIAFEPLGIGRSSSLLVIDGRDYFLSGGGLTPILGSGEVRLDAEVSNAQQLRVELKFPAPAVEDLQGEIQVTFLGNNNRVDQTLQFLPGGEKASFALGIGQQTASFNGKPYIILQTGTLSGRIQLRIRLPEELRLVEYLIADAPVKILEATATREPSMLNVTLTGFDNTLGGASVQFQFHDKDGRPVGELMTVDSVALFRQYFATSQLGGAFSLVARFPVAGDSSQLSHVVVQMANGIGRTEVGRINIR